VNLKYHIYKHNIICPYCDEECRDEDYEVRGEFETKIEFECEHCGKKFLVESNIVYSSYSDCELNGEKHEIEKTHIEGFYLCKHCSEYSINKSIES